MSKLATTGRGEIARPLRVLVPLIKEELAAGDAERAQAGLEHYRRAGEMLLEAKASPEIVHGEWQSWVKRNFHLSYSTATNYMQLAQKASGIHFSTLSAAVRPNANRDHTPPWRAPVQEIITTRLNVNRLAEERQSREKEQRLIRNLALQLIDIGYKVLASKLHPDKGGSQEAMARLNRVRKLLRSAV